MDGDDAIFNRNADKIVKAGGTFCGFSGFSASQNIFESFAAKNKRALSGVSDIEDAMKMMSRLEVYHKRLSPEFLPRVREGRPGPYFEFLLVNKKAQMHVQDLGVYPMPEYYAIGSGADIAIGAMAHGADPEAAVKCAAKHISSVGGLIRTVVIQC